MLSYDLMFADLISMFLKVPSYEPIWKTANPGCFGAFQACQTSQVNSGEEWPDAPGISDSAETTLQETRQRSGAPGRYCPRQHKCHLQIARLGISSPISSMAITHGQKWSSKSRLDAKHTKLLSRWSVAKRSCTSRFICFAIASTDGAFI
jgi:hypothetical protein